MSFRVLIPVRYASTRLPGKPLLAIGGRPMIQHVYEQALRSGAAEVVVATDDTRVSDAARAFGAPVCMTSPDHTSGTERLGEAVASLGLKDDEVVVNVQGDEPLIPPAIIRQVAANLQSNPAMDVATLCEPLTRDEELFDPSVVKVVFDRDGRALYFSRAPIPWCRDHFAASPGSRPEGARHHRHIGLYAYRVAFLKRFADLPDSHLEVSESLEQLRVLENGGGIHVAESVEAAPPGVDTPEDLERVRASVSE